MEVVFYPESSVTTTGSQGVAFQKTLNYKQLSAGKGHGKVAPLQAWSGPEGSRNLRFPDFMTTASW